jgi:hypothetical protein
MRQAVTSEARTEAYHRAMTAGRKRLDRHPASGMTSFSYLALALKHLPDTGVGHPAFLAYPMCVETRHRVPLPEPEVSTQRVGCLGPNGQARPRPPWPITKATDCSHSTSSSLRPAASRRPSFRCRGTAE